MEVLLLLAAAASALPVVWLGRRWWRRPGLALAVDGFPPELSATRRGERPSVVTGDAGFDAQVTLTGDPGRWLLLTTPALRESLRTATALGLSLGGGSFRGVVPAEHRALFEEALTALRLQFDGARTLAERYRDEPEPGVRRRLLEWAVGAGAAPEVVALAVADPDAAVRVTAAEHAGDLDLLTLLACDPAVGRAARDRAFQVLRGRVEPAALAARLLATTGGRANLARTRLAALPPELWVSASVEHLASRWEGEEVSEEVLTLLRALSETGGRQVGELFLRMPLDLARSTLPFAPAWMLTEQWVGEVAAARPELAPALQQVRARVHPAESGAAVLDGAALFTDTGLRWLPAERRAAGHLGPRYVQAAPAVAGTVFRLSPVPVGARISVQVTSDGRWSAQVPGTPAALSWLPHHLEVLLRSGVPGALLHVEDGELRLRSDPVACADVQATLAFLVRVADALDALGPLTEAQRVTAAFRTAPPGSARRELASVALASDPTLAARHLDDPDPEVRRVAGRHAPHPPTLVALLADPSLPLPVRSVALTDLHSLGDREALSAAVRRAWYDEGLVAQALTITNAARLVDQWEELGYLVERLAPASGPVRNLEQDIVRRALYVLIGLEAPQSERLVLRATMSREPALRRAAITGLGRFGTPPMLQALTACARHHPADAPVVERAVAALRQRLGTGGLALVEVAGGELSAASEDPATGALTDLSDPAG